MTKANKVLFITQEITPYVSESEMANIGRNLPQAIQEKGREIRTFMPKWGNINERRNQLHEVIRLSGMNLIIDDTDHPLPHKERIWYLKFLFFAIFAEYYSELLLL